MLYIVHPTLPVYNICNLYYVLHNIMCNICTAKKKKKNYTHINRFILYSKSELSGFIYLLSQNVT